MQQSSNSGNLFLVRGHVYQDGRPLAGARVAAFDRDLRREQPLGKETTTGRDGSYEIAYGPEQFVRAEKGRADLVVRVLDANGRVVAATPILMNAATRETIDLDVPLPDGNSKRSEYGRLVHGLKPLLAGQGIPFAEVTPEDIPFLAVESDLPTPHIAALVLAHRCLRDADAGTDALWYALLRSGLPDDSERLAALGRRAWETALREALRDDVISGDEAGDPERLFRFLEGRYANRVEETAARALETASVVAGIELPSEGAERWRQLAVEHTADARAFWEAVDADEAIGDRRVKASLRFAGQADALTGGDRLLLETLGSAADRGDGPRAYHLAELTRDDWEGLISRAVESGAQLPDGLMGENDAHRAKSYAGLMATAVGAAFPLHALAVRLERHAPTLDPEATRQLLSSHAEADLADIMPDELDAALSDTARLLRREARRFPYQEDDLLKSAARDADANQPFLSPARRDLADLLTVAEASGHDLRRVTAARFLQSDSGKAALERIPEERRGAVTAHLQGVQRVLQFAGRAEQAEALLNRGLDSALAVVGVPEEHFISALATDLGGEHAARAAYAAAQDVAAGATMLYTAKRQNLEDVVFYAIDGQSVFKKPAPPERPNFTTLFGRMDLCDCAHCRSVYSPAAYLVDLLQFLRVDDTLTEGANPPINQLLARRPDIEYLPLTCENTNTPLPYIDLVLEVLESYLGSKVRNDPTRVSGGDTKPSITAARLAAEREYGDPAHARSEFLERWSDAAYADVKTAVYPIPLPFDRDLESTRVYLGHLGATRGELLRRFTPGADPEGPLSPAAAEEYLGLSSVEAAILAGESPTPLAQFYGFGNGDPLFPAAVTTGGGASAPIPELLGRLNMRFVTLLQMLGGRTLTGITLNTPANADPCDLTAKRLIGMTANGNRGLTRLHRAVRLWKRLGGDDDALHILDAALGAWPDNGGVSRTLLNGLAETFRLRNDLIHDGTVADPDDLFVPLLLSLYFDLDRAPFLTFPTDTEGEAVYRSPVYDTLFRNPAVANTPDPDFDGPSAARTLTQKSEAVAAALRVTAPELVAIKADAALADDALTLRNLSHLHRRALLARLLGLSVVNLLTLKRLSGLDPFASPAETRRFLAIARVVRESGVSPGTLAFLLLGEDTDGVAGSLAPNPTDLQATAVALRSGLAQVASDLVSATPVERQAARERLTSQVIAEAFQITPQFAHALLTHLGSFAQLGLAIDLLGDEADPLTNPDPTHPNAAAHNTAQAAVTAALGRAHRAVRLLDGLGVTAEEFAWIDSHRADWAGMDLTRIPLTPAPPPADPGRAAFEASARSLFVAWLALAHLARSRALARRQRNALTLRDVFQAAQSAPLAELRATMASALGLDDKNRAALEGWLVAGGLFAPGTSDAAIRAAFRSANQIPRIVEDLRRAATLGASPIILSGWAVTAPNAAQTDAIRAVAKAGHSPEGWLSAASSLTDVLREKQRDALVAHTLRRPEIRALGITDPNQLFEFFLIDVEMMPCMRTSRIKQAISSVQLFVQRCLLNLESVSPTRIGAGRWRWMKSYRVWEANRKVFLYPSNWIQSALRDNKTPFFTELESDLLQRELTPENVEDSFLKYLRKLDSVSRLEVVGTFRQPSESVGGITYPETIHVVARGPVGSERGPGGDPAIYWYRRFADEIWSPWEKIDLDIVGANVMPVVYNRRLYLMWPVVDKVTQEADNPQPSEQSGSTAGNNLTLNTDTRASISRFSFKLAWSERQENGWSSRRTTAPGAVPTSYVLQPDISEDELRAALYCYTIVDSSGILKAYIYGTGEYINQQNGRGDAPWFQRLGKSNSTDSHGYLVFRRFCNFHFDDAKGYVLAVPDGTNTRNIIGPPNASARHSLYYRRDNGLTLAATNSSQASPVTLLGSSPKAMRVKAFSHESSENNGERYLSLNPLRPFFCADDRRTFFVNPENYTYSIWHFYADVIAVTATQHELTMLNALQIAFLQPEVLAPVPVPEPIPFLDPVADPLVLDGAVVNAADRELFALRSLAALSVENRLAISNGEPNGFDSAVGQFRRGVGGGPRVDGATAFLSPSRRDREDGAGADATGLPTRAVAMSFDTTAEVVAVEKFLTADSVWANTLRYRTEYTETRLRFRTFQHPLSVDFLRRLRREGLFGLLSLDTQRMNRDSPNFNSAYAPNTALVHPTHPKLDVDFSTDGACSCYNWEVFFHAPMLMAERLMDEHKYEEALKWFHVVFDPTTTDTASPAPARFWRFAPFRDNNDPTRIQDLLNTLADPNGDLEVKKEAARQIRAWRDHPFEPHRIARFRNVEYMRWVVTRYVDCLLAWGDAEFMRDTIESINQATQLYVLAYCLLGPRPERIPKMVDSPPLTYHDLRQRDKNGQERLDAFSNEMVAVESEFHFATFGAVGSGTSPSGPGGGDVGAGLALGRSLYFCIPKNDKLLGYWDTVEDRLYKIRHCLNIAGVARSLALFEPPIDPAALVAAVAAGVPLDAAVADATGPQPHYRFAYHQARAEGLASELKALGGALLSALEKGDAEALTVLRTKHEGALLSLTRDVRRQQIEDARMGVTALERQRDAAKFRYDHYNGLSFMNTAEILHTGLFILGNLATTAGSVMEIAAGAARLVPEFQAGGSGIGGTPHVTVRYGGSNVAGSIELFAKAFHTAGNVLLASGQLAQTIGGYQRRAEDWDLQKGNATNEMKQLDVQIESAKKRVEIAENELRNLEQQIAHSREVEEFLRDKYTNASLYSWMAGQLSTLFFQTYKLAYEVARRAERAFRYELGVPSDVPPIITLAYWDSARKGLLSGERLHLDLKRLDRAYHEHSRRELEVERDVSLALLDPVALILLKETGTCTFAIPEPFLDMDHPGHYRRRLKSVAVTLPCVTGPYAGVHGTLRLLNSYVRFGSTAPDPANYIAARTNIADPRFVEINGVPVTEIALSRGQRDAGLFEVALRDERLLPFEGAGAVSVWQLDVPRESNAWDLDTLTDAILHLRYQSSPGVNAEVARRAAVLPALNTVGAVYNGAAAVRTGGTPAPGAPPKVPPSQPGLARVFSLRHEFPDAYRAFLRGIPPSGAPDAVSVAHRLSLTLGPERFPYPFRGRRITIQAWELLLQFADEVALDSANDGTASAPRYPGTSATLTITLTLPSGVMRPAQSLALNAALDRTPYAAFTGFNVGLPATVPWLLQATEGAITGLNPFLTRTEPDDDGNAHPRLNASRLQDVALIVRYGVQ